MSAFTEGTPCGLVLAKALRCVRHCFVNAGTLHLQAAGLCTEC